MNPTGPSAITIGSRSVGPGSPCFIVAEVGINHNGMLDTAHAMVDAAADVRVDAVKFQNYHTDEFLTDRSLEWEYDNGTGRVRESQYDMFSRYELVPESFSELREHCRERKVEYLSTPSGTRSLQELSRLAPSAIKNGSDALGNLPLLKEMARTRLPTVISVGMATIAEIDESVRAFHEAGGRDLILLHCTSAYPVSPDEVNLARIHTLGAAFQTPVGFSDHTQGTVAGIGAAVLGACMIEKHFTLDKTMSGPDHSFSADPNEMNELVNSIRLIERQIGSPEIGPVPSETLGRREGRWGCVAARGLTHGTRLQSSDLAIRRPGTGAHPRDLPWLLGRRLARDRREGQPIGIDDID